LIVPHGCSENATAPEEELLVETGFLFDYETDDALAVTRDVTPAGGGTLDCTGADGVEYSLEVWPGAVSQNTSVTMTPLKYLTISEIDDGASASPTDAADEEACNVGVWLEPAGLEFDSTVVLTVNFPDSISCGVGNDLRGIFVDPDRTFYTIMPTDVDTVASVLACTLSHFSIYGTDDVTYDYLKKLIEETTEYGLENPTLQITTDLMVCAEEAQLGEWPDLDQLAINGIHKVLNKLAPIVNQQALAALTEASVVVWFKVWERAHMLDFTDTEATLDAGMTKVVNRMVLRGKEWCGSDKEEEGRAMLWRAWEYVESGLWQHNTQAELDAKKTEIDNAIDACSGITIWTIPQDDVVYDIALSENDTDTYVDVLVRVFSALHKPMADQSVNLSVEFAGEEHYHKNVGSKQTDSEGEAWFRVSFGRAYAPTGNYHVTASTHHNDEVYLEKAPLELKRRLVTLTYSYTSNYAKSTEGHSNTISATYSSSGTRPVVSTAGCDMVEQSLTQSSSTDMGTYTHTASHNSLPMEISACFFEIYTVTHQTEDEFRTPYFVISKLSVGMRAPIYTRMPRVVFDGVETDEDIITQDAVVYFGMPYPPYPESNEVFINYDDGFEDYTFSGTTIDELGSADLTITATLEEGD
jgi:hypothetical protein